MYAKKFTLIFIYLYLCFASSEKDLPSYFPRCYREDPDLNQCLLKATEQVRPFLQKGVPELHIPPLSPFFIPEVNLQLGTDALNYKSTIKNVVLTGLDTYNFTKFDFDVENLNFSGSVNMGFITLKGDYSIAGRILTVPIEGKGVVNSNITSSNGTLWQNAKFVTRKGVSYIESENTTIKIDVHDVQTDYSGLFDGNEILARAAKAVVKENLKEIVKEVTPAIEEIFTRFMNDILFKGVYRIPYDKLYPIRNKNR